MTVCAFRVVSSFPLSGPFGEKLFAPADHLVGLRKRSLLSKLGSHAWNLRGSISPVYIYMCIYVYAYTSRSLSVAVTHSSSPTRLESISIPPPPSFSHRCLILLFRKFLRSLIDYILRHIQIHAVAAASQGRTVVYRFPRSLQLILLLIPDATAFFFLAPRAFDFRRPLYILRERPIL